MQVLVSLGFSANKVKVYLACLRLGAATAREIAKESGIGRTSIYDIVGGLAKEGLIDVGRRGGVRCYIAEDPKKLVALFRQRTQELENWLPQLLRTHKTVEGKPEITMYEGTSGIKKALEDSLQCRERVIYSFTPVPSLIERLGRIYLSHYVEKRVKEKISIKTLRGHSDRGDRGIFWELYSSDPNLLREVRSMPPSLKLESLIRVYDDRVMVVSGQKSKVAFVVKSKDLAEFLKGIHIVIWDMSKRI